ncbi:MAG TPA: response regulator, partial [Candidatus Thermoplasmatota archaeon]
DLALLATLVERVVPTGSRIDQAATAELAMELLRTNTYDAVVADVHLDGLSGIDVCAEAKRIQPDAVRILVTSDQNLSTLQDALAQTRVDAYLLKRWGEDRMSAQLARFLSDCLRR